MADRAGNHTPLDLIAGGMEAWLTATHQSRRATVCLDETFRELERLGRFGRHDDTDTDTDPDTNPTREDRHD